MASSKKILMVVNVDWFFLSHRLPVALALKEKGYDVTIIATDTGDADLIRENGLSFIDMPDLEKNRSLLFELQTVAHLAELYNKLKPDLVHHVTIRPVLYGSLAARLAGVPAVVNAMSGLGYVYTHHTFKSKMVRSVLDRLFRIGFSHSNSKLILQNKDDLQLFLKRELLPETNIELIRGSGVDTQHFYPNQTKNKTISVALIGRMLWDKGVHEFIEAGKILSDRGVQFEFHLYGAPYASNPMSIPESEIQSWKILTWLTYHGHVNDISIELKKIDIVCLPSYREGLPKALLEAASAGKPIVTTDAPGCREVVEDGVNGFLVPARNSLAIAEKIELLINDESLRQRFGEAGRIKVIQEFSEEIVISKTLDLYDEQLYGHSNK